MQRPLPETATLDDILITQELSRRSPRSTNLQAENQAMRSLARQMAGDSKTLLQTLVEIALELCQAGTAGVSLLETSDQEEVFRWSELAGRFRHDGTIPRDFSPCGVCLDGLPPGGAERGTPQLFSHPELYFTYLQAAKIPIVEALLLPLIANDQAIGAIWIMSHDENRHFDAEDVRLMTSLADFTATALMLNQRQTGELLAVNAALEAEIVERKQTEAQLSEVQRRLELSLTGASLGIWTYRVATDEFWADDRAHRMHGHEPHEVHTFAESGTNIYPEDRDRAQAAFAQVIQNRSKLQIEYRVIWRDGSIHWIASYADIPTGGQGDGMFYGVVQDITEAKRDEIERQQTEAQLRESEERLRVLIENLPGGAAFVVDRDLRYLLAEGEALSTAGFQPEDFVGHTLCEVLPPDLVNEYKVLYRQALAGEPFEHEHNAHDHAYISRGTPLRAANGEVYAVLAVSYDITERKQAEIALRESEHKLQSAIAVAQLSPYEWNPATGEIKWDAQLKAIWGLPANAEIDYDVFLAGLHPDDRESVERQVAASVAPDGNGIYEDEFRVIGIEDKIERWVSARGQTFFDAERRPVHFVGVAQDITTRKQREAAFRESEERLRLATEAADMYAWEFDLRTSVPKFSENVERVTGHLPTSDFEENLKLVHPDDRAIMRQAFEDVLTNGNRFEYEMRSFTQDNQMQWFLVSGVLIRDTQNVPVRSIGISQNITERKRAEAALRESEERFRTLANTAPALIWYNDAQGNNLFINQYFLDFTGKSLEQIRGEGWHNLVHPDDAELYIADYLAAVREQRSWHNRNRIRRHDGAWRWHDNYAQPLFGADGVYLGHVGVTIDNTDAIEAENALRESEDKFRTFVSAASDIIYEMSADWREMRSLKGKEFITSTENPRHDWMEEYIPETDKPQVWAAINRAIAKRSNFELEHRVIRLDGTVGWTFSRAIPLFDETGEVVKWFGVASDITEQKQAEVALRESEAKYRSLFETIGEGFCIFELIDDETQTAIDYRFLEVNQVFERQTGLQNAVGKLGSEIAPNTERYWLEAYDKVARTGEPLHLENYNQSTGRWYVAYASRVGGAGSRQVCTVFDDITDRKQAEQELTKTNQLLQATFDNSLQVIQLFKAVRDERGDIADFEWLLTNKQWNDQWGKMAGKRLLRENPAVVETGLFEMFKQVTESGVPITHEHHYAHEQFDGWFWQTIAQVEDGFLLSTIDITDRKYAEAALRESEEKYRSLFETMDEGYLLSEVIFDENGEPIDILYLEANPAAVRLAGQDFSGQRMREIDSNYEEYWYEIYGRVALTGESVRTERYAEPHDQWFDFYAFKVGGQESRRVAVVFKDITDRKQQEQRQAFLLQLSDILRAEPDASSIASRAVRMLAEHLRVDRFWLSEVFEQQGISTVGPEYHRPDLPPMSGVYRLSDYPKTMRQLLTQPMVIHDVASDPNFSDSEKALLNQLHLRALLVMSLRKGQNQVIWALAAAMTTSRHWNESERVLVEEVGERVWAAIERARAEAALRESEVKYRTLFQSIDQGYCLVELILQEGKPIDWLYLETNQSYHRQTGLGDMVGKRQLEFVPNLEPEWFDFYGNVARTGEPARMEYPVEAIGRWFTVYASRVGGEGSLLVAIVFEDITDRKQQEQRQAYMLQLSDALRSLSDAVEIQATVTRTTMNLFGTDRCYYCEIIDGDIIIRRDAAREDLPSVVGVYPLENSPIFKAMLDAGQPFAIEDVHTTDILSENLRQACFQLQIISFIIVPVIKQGEPVGILSINQTTPRNWTAFEIDLAEETADRTWATIERARAEAALRESEARWRLALEAAELGTFLYHPQEDRGEPDARMLALFGLGEGDTLNLAEALAKMIYPDDRELYAAAAATALNPNGDGKLYAEIRVIHPDESLHWVAVTAQTVFEGEPPQPVRMYGIAADITERKRVEDERKQAQEDRIRLIQEQSAREEERQRAESLVELDRAKTLFFSNVSHEFRTPLTLSLAPLQDALNDRAHPLDPVQRERMEVVHRNSLRLLKLVNTLLDFSRIEAGRMAAVYEPTDLATFTTELASVFRSVIEQAGLRLIVNCPPLPKAVYVDRQMWEKIVLNLISNAFKFTLEGEISVRLQPIADRVILEVEDTGTGIAPEELPHLFERFYQVRGVQARLGKAHASRTHEGSGIGLALVQELVQLQGGIINVSSTLGQGSCFTITLPFGAEHLPQERIKASPSLTSTASGATAYLQEAELWLPQEKPRNWGQETEKESVLAIPDLQSPMPRILIVDDNADMRDYLTRILSDRVQVEAVADGATALLAAQTRIPDLILSDVMMPGLDGFGLLQALRADPRTREVPIILLSARAGEEAIIEGLEAGADDYLIKPFSAAELVSRVNAHLQMAQLHSEALAQERTLNRRKDELLSIVSHELNTPLVAILGWTRLLRATPPSQSMLIKSLETIERNAMLQAKLIQDLLDISRIEAGKLRLRLEPVQLKSVIENAIAAVLTAAIAKDIHLELQHSSVAEASEITMIGDRDRLQQIICNLLTNAIKFTPNSGSVTVELAVIKGEPETSYAQIKVSDTGIGISGDFLPHVFDHFRQAESGLAGGLGLGLAIARHLVQLHNGTLHAESSGVGQGATFTVKLPILQ